MRVLTLTHGEDVGPELFADVATAEGHELRLWDMQQDGPPPVDVDAVVVFGGHQNVGEESRYPWLRDEYAAMRTWVDAEVPLFAVCLGAQTLAHALGAAVERLDDQLVGFQPTRLTADGRADPVLGSLPAEFEAFNGNHYACSLPAGATALATGPCLQAFRAGDHAWAVQFHPEIKRHHVLAWFDGDDRTTVARQLEQRLSEWTSLGARLFSAFLRQAA